MSKPKVLDIVKALDAFRKLFSPLVLPSGSRAVMVTFPSVELLAC